MVLMALSRGDFLGNAARLAVLGILLVYLIADSVGAPTGV